MRLENQNKPNLMSINSRRRFLVNSSMVTAALVAAKPFTSIANRISPVTGFRVSTNNLVLAHTGDLASVDQTLQHIQKLKNADGNLIMLHAGNHTPAAAATVYDASMHTGEVCSVASNDYKIIHKGDIKTGIITATEQSASVESINALATYLKKEKNCNLVVCLSQLGFRSTGKPDDLTLAAESTDLDIIIGGHASNFCKSPMTTRNKNREEVIINHAATEGLALRKIEITFNNRGQKHLVAFTRSC